MGKYRVVTRKQTV